jgi:uncharacterized protein
MKELKVFRDPLYGYIKVFEQVIWDLIQTKEFQRLRRIHQLGGTSMVFHTAEHSRFSHSLGVYEVARQVLFEVEQIRTTLTKEERIITLCAALLHDLGHGPYSHAFEYVFNTNHEQFTIDIIKGNTEVHEVLESYQVGLSEQVANIIAKQCFQLDKCNADCNHHIMIHLISSQLDVDRLDYLQRDAYNTGATYGEIDLDRIIRGILVVNKQIAYKSSSMHAIENYLMSRYHMYWQVYYHPVSISHEVLLVKIFNRVKDLIHTNYNFNTDVSMFKKIFTENLSIEEYLELDESWMNFHIKEWSKEHDPILKDLSSRLINRKLLKYISCETSEELEKLHLQLSQLLIANQIEPKYYLHKDTLVKEAYQYYNNEIINKHNSIFLMHKNKLVEIAELSHIVKGIKDIGAKKDYKVFYPIELINQLRPEEQLKFESIVNEYM